jgi:hypothetical protein
MMTPTQSLRSLRKHPAGCLLAAQFLAIFLYPFFEATKSGKVAIVVFSNLMLVLTLLVVIRSPLFNWIGWALAVPALILSWLGHIGGFPGVLSAAHMLEAALYFYAAAGLIVYMLGDTHVTIDEILAAGATFTLLACSFGYAFAVCQFYFPGSFVTSLNPSPERTPMELLYFSFSILSGVGLSDVTPAKGGGRALVMLEMFCGIMYITIIVSRLVALTLIHLKKGDPPASSGEV